MSWQDVALSVGSVVFTAALIPSMVSHHKPALTTSLSTFALLVVFVIAYASLGLCWAATTTACTALAWGVLAVQGMSMRSKA